MVLTLCKCQEYVVINGDEESDSCEHCSHLAGLYVFEAAYDASGGMMLD